MQTATFSNPHGVEITYHRWPVDPAKAVVVIAHGASEHGARYERFAADLNAAGYDAWAIDHRGHGRTRQATGIGRLGEGPSTVLVEDLAQLVDLAASDHAGVPVVVFGHSMGALITQGAIAEIGDRIAGYVLSGCPGPMAEGADELIDGIRAAVDAGMADEALPELGPFNEAFEPARTRYDWLSTLEDEVDAYIDDPHCGDDNPLTYRYVLAMLEVSVPAMEPEALAAQPKVPVLLVTGEQDAAAGMGDAPRELQRRMEAAGVPVTGKFYPDARHELLNDKVKDEVTADIVAWLDDVVG